MEELSLAEKVKSFKEGQAKVPVVHKSIGIKVNEGGKQVVLTKEEMDRDGETVMMDGMRLPAWIKENGIPLIDSHNSRSSVTENGLGALRNPRVEMIDGVKALVTDPDFAPTPKGNVAKTLYMGVDGGKPYFTNVSMGFLVYDYDNATKTILEWEPFEGSLVTIGSNMGARFVNKSAESEEEAGDEVVEEMAKNLARFKQIQAPFKEFTKLFLGDSFCELIGYQKDGDMLVDINAIHDLIQQKFAIVEEAPLEQAQPVEQKQKLVASPAAVEKAILDALIKKLY